MPHNPPPREELAPIPPPARSEIVGRFRDRLAELFSRSGLKQAAFARKIGLDRSTLSQLLAATTDRLPRAENIASIARAEGVSIDWLLGLSEEGQAATDVMRRSIQVERDARSPADRRLDRWHDEAAGYLIRYVPATLPDLLKTEQVIEFEYRESAAFTPEQSITTAEQKLAYLRRPQTLMEVCMSRQRLEVFSRGEGIWRGLGDRARRNQLKVMRQLVQELYPALRVFLYDDRQRYSVPVIVFGPKRAVVYCGQMYLSFTGTEHVQLFTQHFDDLVRSAVVQPTDIASFLARLES
ncbi:MAG TPA: helix-turn-helix domain-containing protein [Kofleriaceae bacterium]